MHNRIHILGAAGSGTSTLGQELSIKLPHVHFDTDDFYWEDKFTRKREIKQRIRLLEEDFSRHRQWVLSGALCGWGDELRSHFDLVIFLWIPKEIRLERIKNREYQRYGETILPGGSRHEHTKQFLEWASLYDEAGVEVRSKALHEQWMSELTCPILRIEGDYTVKQRVDNVLDYLN